MNIGNLKLKNRFLLAPMLEPNDVAFRLLCKRAGCGLTYTGMVSPLSKQKMVLDDKPAVQLFGNDARGITSFIKKYEIFKICIDKRRSRTLYRSSLRRPGRCCYFR